MRRLRLLYPLLIAVYPALWITSINPGEYHLADLLTVLAAVFAVSGVVYAAVGVLLWKSYSREIIAAIAALLNGWMFLYLPASESIMRGLSVKVTHWYVVPIVAPATAIVALWMLRRKPVLESATKFLAIAAFVLFSQAAARVIYSESRVQATIRDSAIVRRLALPIPKRADSITHPRMQHDIYLIVLDMYANSQVLRDHFQFDNTAFEDSLRGLGFTLPVSVRSNYTYTSLSLASMLNAHYVSEVRGEHERTGLGENLSNYLVENNRTVRFLKDAGYKFVFFPSPWWKSTRRNRHADDQFFAWDTGIRRKLWHTSLRRQVANMTPLRWLESSIPTADASHVFRSFEALSRVADRPEPTLTFAHFLFPHPPILVDADCRELPARTPELPQAYVAQLQCANRRLIGLVTNLLARSDPSPIILIQGDHGTRTVKPAPGDRGNTVTAAAVRERLGAFGAYFLPAGGAEILGDSITAVNLMRVVLSNYFGADLPALSDSLFYSPDRRVMEFFPVSVQGSQVTPAGF